MIMIYKILRPIFEDHFLEIEEEAIDVLIQVVINLI
jgi:hypothetical protein